MKQEKANATLKDIKYHTTTTSSNYKIESKVSLHQLLTCPLVWMDPALLFLT